MPSIKFIGKRSLGRPSIVETSPAIDYEEYQERAVYFGSLGGSALFGRPNLSNEEMAAIESGGADIVEDYSNYSTSSSL